MSLQDEIANPMRRVLLVEDEALVAMIAARAALDHARTDCAKFDFAVVDIGLPDRPGDHLISDLRKMCPDLPIIIASGYGEGELRRSFKAYDKFAFLNKTYERTSLRAAIDSLGLPELPGDALES